MKSMIIFILVSVSGLAHASQETESVVLAIQGKWHEQGQACGTILQFEHPDIVYIKTGESEAQGTFTVDDGPVISPGFRYRFDIQIRENNGISACNNSVLYEVGDFPPMSFRLEERDTLIIEGAVFRRGE